MSNNKRNDNSKSNSNYIYPQPYIDPMVYLNPYYSNATGYQNNSQGYVEYTTFKDNAKYLLDNDLVDQKQLTGVLYEWRISFFRDYC